MMGSPGYLANVVKDNAEDNSDIWESSKAINIATNDSDSEEVEEVVLEEPIVHKDKIKDNKGASTPSTEFPHVYHCFLEHTGYTQRRSLWTNLSLHKNYIRNRLWCLLGDFNVALYLVDHSTGPSTFDISMREFKDRVEDIEVSDVNHSGLRFTWNQKPQGDAGTLKKIDRVMANLKFNDVYTSSHAIFQPYRISDHSSAVLKVPMVSLIRPKTFKFLNILVHDVRFQDIVRDGWSRHVSGFYMFQVVKKLKFLKKPLQACYVKAFNDALLMEEPFLQQKAKIDWLKAGDSNLTYFHKVVKGRISRSRIDVVSCSDGSQLEGDQVAVAFVAHYTSFLGQQGVLHLLDTNDLFMNKLDSNVALDMVKTVTPQEVKEAIFSMGNDKSPGPDGYTAAFFKEA
ncbi:RNA-directed DNA polymerase, eukaryota, reverse transcriptase zinc-binding domain protein [Tanacetum coccineum]